MAIIFRELGSTGNYFQGFGEQVHSFGDLGSPAKSQKNLTLMEKPSFCLILQKISLADPPPPLGYLNVFTFLLTC